MNRATYHRQRRNAHRLECEAALLRGTHYQVGTVRAAKSLRADLSPPVDEAEQARNERLADLHRALRLAQQAKALRQQARLIVRPLHDFDALQREFGLLPVVTKPVRA